MSTHELNYKNRPVTLVFIYVSTQVPMQAFQSLTKLLGDFQSLFMTFSLRVLVINFASK